MPLYRILLDPQGGPEGGNPASTDDDRDGSHGEDVRPIAVYQKLLKERETENFKLRDKVRELEARVAPEGAIVLTGDEAKRWQGYRDLPEPGELRKSLKQAEADSAEVERFRKAEQYDEAATLSGFNPRAFRRLAEQDGLQTEIKTVKQGSEESRVVHVKGKDEAGNDTSTPLAKYAETHWAEFLPSLQGGERKEPPRPNGTPPRRNNNGPPPPPGPQGDPLEQALRASGMARF